MKKVLNRVLSVVLSLVMCVSVLNLTAFAGNAKKGCGIHEGCICGEHLIEIPGNHEEIKQCSNCGCIWTHKGNGESSEGNGGAEWKDPVECPHKDPVTGASWLTEKVITDPGCERTGEKKVSCTHCSYEKTEPIPALGHDYTGTAWADDCGDTCNHSQSGNHIKACQRSDALCTNPHNSQTEAHSYPAIAADAGWTDYTGSDHGQTYDPDTQKVQQRTHQCIGCTHNWVEYRVVDLEVVPSPDTYTVIVNYVDGTGAVLQSPYTQTVEVGQSYDVSSAKSDSISKDGVTYTYTSGGDSMSGDSAAKDAQVVITLVYTAEAPEATYTLTVNHVYLNADGTQNTEMSTSTKTSGHKEGDSYTTSANEAAGYTVTVSGTASGTFGTEDITVTYTYRPSVEEAEAPTLTVNHVYRYHYLNGTMTTSTQTEGPTAYEANAAYTTSANARGYRLAGTPANASGVFGTEDIIVTYYYDAYETDDEPTPPPTPPEQEIDEPDVPLVEEPDVDIEEPEVPLVEEPEIEIEIEEPDVPLADVPETGDGSGLWFMSAVLSAMGLALLFFTRKREGQEG